MTERERWEELLSQDIPVMVKAPFTGEPMCIDLLQFGITELESFINFLVSHGAILPPVTVGQTVYIISDYTHEIIERSIVKVIVAEDHYDFIFDTQSCWRDTEIGKTVFLTREDAEAELKKRRKEVNTT